MVDFGADVSFAEAEEKIKTHYGVVVPASSVRIITEKHAQIIHNNLDTIQKKCCQSNNQAIIIAQTDGSMVPIVEFKNEALGDRRKFRITKWSECRLGLAYPKGSVTPIYGAVFGSVDEAGEELRKVVDLAGRVEKSRIHAVGDGAPWVADQIEQKFGDQANFLLDFYHLSEYLHRAAEYCAPESPMAWATIQKQRMKNTETPLVMKELEKYINAQEYSENSSCPVRTCYNYMLKRTDQLNYKEAIDNDLPIGSGEIESAHRSVIQKRLKLPGGWWLRTNAQVMASLRVVKANNAVKEYWAGYKMSEFVIN